MLHVSEPRESQGRNLTEGRVTQLGLPSPLPARLASAVAEVTDESLVRKKKELEKNLRGEVWEPSRGSPELEKKHNSRS